MVEVATNIKTGEKELKRDYPHEEGLEVGTTKQEGTKDRLTPAQKSFIRDKYKEGLD